MADARAGDEAAFELMVGRHRGELHAHCYRMLGSVQDAEDAVQESLLAAWRGLAGFEGRSSLRTWLYRVATHAGRRLSSRRPRRVLSSDHGPARSDSRDLGDPVSGPVWLEPRPDDLSSYDEPDPAAAYLRQESVELAFVAALQHLPGTQLSAVAEPAVVAAGDPHRRHGRRRRGAGLRPRHQRADEAEAPLRAARSGRWPSASCRGWAWSAGS